MQEIKAETAQHGLRASFQEEAEKCLKEVRPSPKPQDSGILNDRDSKNRSGRGDSQAGQRGKSSEDPDDTGRILDVLC
jgi:hypothetical protein